MKPRPADWAQRERLVAQHADGRCECISGGHGHGIERCHLLGDQARPRGDRNDYRLPNLMWVCQLCAGELWPAARPADPVDAVQCDPTPTEVIELPPYSPYRDTAITEAITFPMMPRTLPLPLLG